MKTRNTTTLPAGWAITRLRPPFHYNPIDNAIRDRGGVTVAHVDPAGILSRGVALKVGDAMAEALTNEYGA